MLYFIKEHKLQERDMVSLFFVLGQILIFISYLIFWISLFRKHKSNILLWDNVSRFFAIVAFVCLGTYDGVKMTLFIILRNILGQITNKKRKRDKILTFIIMLILLILMYCFQFNNLSTICITICGILNLYGVIMSNEQGIRMFCMIGSAFYNAFLFLTGNIIGVICETICFVVMLCSYIKYRNSYNDSEFVKE